MSKFIEVDHSKIDSAVSAIENNIDEIDRILNQADERILGLKSSWSGSDFEAYKHSYQSDKGVKATCNMAKKALKARADFLKFCSGEYKSAQADAVNRARSI
jgi:uncharacterized protein YukE